MLKVFLVEDEAIVRESLRDNIPWTECGFEFAGEAGDGESALPLIQKVRPDVLITDIKMPFMDGLSLCHIAGQEFPSMKMIIMSGYDDFEYARRAIREGVEQYLMKPITRKSMREALEEVRRKIENEQEQAKYMEQYRLESREYEQLQRREFLEKVFSGRASAETIYEEAKKLNLDISAEAFACILFTFHDRHPDNGTAESETYQRTMDELGMFFLRSPAYIMSGWSLGTFAVIVKGSAESVPEYVRKALMKIEEVCEMREEEISWYAAASDPVMRFSELKNGYAQANHAFACRYLMPETHILTKENVESILAGNREKRTILSMDASRTDTAVIDGFLKDGQMQETEEFVERYLSGFSDVIGSRIFRSYMALNIRFAVITFIRSLGYTQEEFTEGLNEDGQDFVLEEKDMGAYLVKLLCRALEYRDRESKRQGSRVLKEAKDYLEANFASPDLSLNSAAAAVGVSGPYLSTVFSKESGKTFVEFLTQRRMEEACRLLEGTSCHTQEIAAAVGYRDPHYFSYVFRKTMGCSVKEYRAQGKRNL